MPTNEWQSREKREIVGKRKRRNGSIMLTTTLANTVEDLFNLPRKVWGGWTKDSWAQSASVPLCPVHHFFVANLKSTLLSARVSVRHHMLTRSVCGI